MTLARIVFVSSLAIATAACGGSVEQQPQTSASAVSKAPVAQTTHGAVKMMGDALGEVSLRADQRTRLEQLAADAEARHAPTIAGRTDLMSSFAAMIEAGTIDPTTLQAKLDVVTGDFEKLRVDDRAAIVKAHDLLDKEQRNDFADALEHHFKAKHEGRAQLKELASELNLTPDQKDQIKDVLKGAKHDLKGDMRAWKRHGNPAEAFREDKLDLDEAMPPVDLKAASQHIVPAAQKLVPILTPAQRKLVADKIRTFAAQGDASLLVH